MTLQKLFLTFFGTGLSPKAPATTATVLALFIGIAVINLLGMETLFMLTLAVVILGIFEINKLDEHFDSSSLVIDKVPGMWLALMISVSTAVTMSYPYVELLSLIFAFASYRLFEAWKPSTIGWIHKTIKGGLGIIMDDVLAGIAGGLLSVVILMGIEKIF